MLADYFAFSNIISIVLLQLMCLNSAFFWQLIFKLHDKAFKFQYLIGFRKDAITFSLLLRKSLEICNLRK